MIILLGTPIHPDPNPNPNPNPLPENHQRRINIMNTSTDEELPDEFYGRLLSIGANVYHDPKLIFRRSLYTSDVDRGLNRLAMPHTQLRRRFLRDDQQEFLKTKGADGKMNKLQVTVLDPALRRRCLTLSRWNYHKSAGKAEAGCSYALNGGWFDLVRDNGLVVGDDIQVWSFELADGSLGLIVNKVEGHGGGFERGSSSGGGDGGRCKRRRESNGGGSN